MAPKTWLQKSIGFPSKTHISVFYFDTTINFNLKKHPTHGTHTKKSVSKILKKFLTSEKTNLRCLQDCQNTYTHPTTNTTLSKGRNSSFLFYGQQPKNHVTFATHLSTLKYLPINVEKFEHVENLEYADSSMSSSRGVIILNTAEVRDHIMKWALMCALDVNCIAPADLWVENPKPNQPIVKQFCPKQKNLNQVNICHRYDQSILSILVRNLYGYDTFKYQIMSYEPENFIGKSEPVRQKELELKSEISAEEKIKLLDLKA